jgi:hypothetical protein
MDAEEGSQGRPLKEPVIEDGAGRDRKAVLRCRERRTDQQVNSVCEFGLS